MLERCIEHQGDHVQALNLLGRCYAERASEKRDAGDPQCLSDWAIAERLFRKAIDVDADYEKAKANLAVLREDVRRYLARKGDS